MTRKYLKLEFRFQFKFQVFPSHQDRKTNSFVCFLGEVTTWQFCFEIYWPLALSSSALNQKVIVGKPLSNALKNFVIFLETMTVTLTVRNGQTKGQNISKQNCRAVTFPPKRTNPTQDSILSAFRSFFGRRYSSTILFRDLLTFRMGGYWPFS